MRTSGGGRGPSAGRGGSGRAGGRGGKGGKGGKPGRPGGKGDRRSTGAPPPPHPSGVKVGQGLDLAITGLNSSGNGVGRHGEQLVVFVPLACPGDEIRAEVTELRRDFAVARILEIRRPSEHRVRAVCPVFGTCGGCQLQHIDYQHQLVLKTNLVREALVRIGKLESPVVLPCRGMEHPWGYRAKGQFPIGERRGRLVAGFYAQGSHRLVPIESCPVQHPTNNRLMADAVATAGKYGITAYNERTGEGLLRHVLTKVAADTGQAMVAFVTNARAFAHEQEIARELSVRLPALASVVQNVNLERTNRILGQVTRTLYGEPAIEDRMGGLRFRVSAESFVQTNPEQAKVTYDQVLAYAQVDATKDAVDAYCGIGTITLMLARKARHVYGIENVAAAVGDARQNAKLNRLDNVEFVLADAEKGLPELIRRGVRPNVLVLDPPRKGVDHQVVRAALEMAPDRIVYVSCEPSTMARDLGKLAAGVGGGGVGEEVQREDGGGAIGGGLGVRYRLVEAQPVDMFPHTAHVETVALLERVE